MNATDQPESIDQQHEQDRKSDGKVQPIKLNKEELARRKETGYTEEEAKTVPGGKGGQANKQGEQDKNTSS